jgi:hypothetical protein
VNVLKEVFRTGSAVLEAIYPACSDADVTPFVGPSRWTAVRFGVISDDLTSNPALASLVSSGAGVMSMLSLICSEGMKNLLSSEHATAGAAGAQSAQAMAESQLSVVDEMVRISRNCVLLGSYECIRMGRTMLPVFLQWLRHASSSVYNLIGQIVGVLSMRISEEDGKDVNLCVENLWRVLQHKLKEEGGRYAVGAIGCMTAVVESLTCESNVRFNTDANSLLLEDGSRVVHMGCHLVQSLLEILQPSRSGGVGTETSPSSVSSALQVAALDALDILGSRGFFGTESTGDEPTSTGHTFDPALTCRPQFAVELQAAMRRHSNMRLDPEHCLVGVVIELCGEALHGPVKSLQGFPNATSTANTSTAVSTGEESKSNRKELSKKDVAVMCAALNTISKILSAAPVAPGMQSNCYYQLLLSLLLSYFTITSNYHLLP